MQPFSWPFDWLDADVFCMWNVRVIKDLVREYNLAISPRRLGQHFLVDPKALARIVATLGVAPGDPVLEIGAGLGALTEGLIATGAFVTAVERDPRFVQVLTSRFRQATNLTLIRSDILKLELASVARAVITPPLPPAVGDSSLPPASNPPQTHRPHATEQGGGGTSPGNHSVSDGGAQQGAKPLGGAKRLLVVGNIPFSITSPILEFLLHQRIEVKRAVLTVQKEVAQRIVARPGTKAYASITLLAQVAFKPSIAFTIPPNAFYPQPKVTSAVLCLDSLPQPVVPPEEEEAVLRWGRLLFTHRRKTLLNALVHPAVGLPKEEISKRLRSIGIDPIRRPETLSLQDFIQIHRVFIKEGVGVHGA
jgi:16S rRNA (adenine1518-N6/adenine1519-N6)-dimethyltransferase